MSERHQYKQGDTVRVKPAPSEASRLISIRFKEECKGTLTAIRQYLIQNREMTDEEELASLRAEVAYLRSALAGFMDIANQYEAAHREKIQTDEYYKGSLDGQVKMAALAANILRKVATDEAGTEAQS